MRSISGLGRTVLFVSHNMPAVGALCERTFLLEQGRLIKSGPTDDVLRDYHERYQGGANEDFRVVTSALHWRDSETEAPWTACATTKMSCSSLNLSLARRCQ